VSKHAGPAVCDIGCGAGNWIPVYAQGLHRLHLNDISGVLLEEALRAAQLSAPRATISTEIHDFFEGEAPAAFLGFDTYLLAFVLGHGDLNERLRALTKLRPVVSDGARVLVVDALRVNASMRQDTYRYVSSNEFLVGVRKHYFDADEVRELSARAGFSLNELHLGRRYFLAVLC
jgi:SAM-dependent methyltransferase